METTAAQATIVETMKQDYIRPNGVALSIVDARPTKEKGERIEGILQPKYSNMQMWHYHGGNCQILEEELILQHPPHDDLKDALASAVEMVVPPTAQKPHTNKRLTITPRDRRGRFGG